jgi:hypothetical protein
MRRREFIALTGSAAAARPLAAGAQQLSPAATSIITLINGRPAATAQRCSLIKQSYHAPSLVQDDVLL